MCPSCVRGASVIDRSAVQSGLGGGRCFAWFFIQDRIINRMGIIIVILILIIIMSMFLIAYALLISLRQGRQNNCTR